MDQLDEFSRLLIENSRSKLIQWCRENYPLLGLDYAENNLYTVGTFYGLSRLEEEDIQQLASALEQDEIEDMGNALNLDDEVMLNDGLNQWGGWFNFDEPNQDGGVENSDDEEMNGNAPGDADDDFLDAWENVNLDNLFKLTKLGEKHIKKFNSTEIRYEVEIARLPSILTPEKSMQLMPKILRKILEICTEECNPDDRVVLSLECQALDPPIYLSMRRFADFSVDALMQKIELLNSQNKLCVDDSFRLRLFRTVMPAGGKTSKRKHLTIKSDRKRFAGSVVTVSVGNNLCLPAALILGEFRLTHDITQGAADYSNWKSLIHPNRLEKITSLSETVLNVCGIAPGKLLGLDDIQKLQRKRFQNFQIKVISVEHGNCCVMVYPKQKTADMLEIFLLLENNHFDLITTPSGYFCSTSYCSFCDAPFSIKEKHLCNGKCHLCYRNKEDCPADDRRACLSCRRIFSNDSCFAIHKNVRKNMKTYCEELRICEECGAFVNLRNRKDSNNLHRCGEMYCRTCSDFVMQAGHQCFLKPLEPEELSDGLPLHIYFDYETWNSPDGHKANLVIAQYTDGTEFRFPNDDQPMDGTASEQFGKWLFQPTHKNHTIVAHNFRSYDGQFVLSYLLDNNLKGISVIKRGNQLLDLQNKSLHISARDTLNFVAQKLSNFPKAVGLNGMKQKGDFPHHYNSPEQWDKIVDFPEIIDYFYDNLKTKDKKKFAEWYAEEKLRCSGKFNFREQIVKYCSNDVTVLRKCALKFREDFIALTGMDPYQSVTIASACQKYFRTYLLKENEIGIISANGYQPNRKTSLEATQWLEWENMSANGRIIHGTKR